MDFPCPLEVPSKTRQEAKISRLLTLIVVAVVYTYLHDWSTRFKESWQAGSPAAVEVPVAAEEETP